MTTCSGDSLERAEEEMRHFAYRAHEGGTGQARWTHEVRLTQLPRGDVLHKHKQMSVLWLKGLCGWTLNGCSHSTTQGGQAHCIQSCSTRPRAERQPDYIELQHTAQSRTAARLCAEQGLPPRRSPAGGAAGAAAQGHSGCQVIGGAASWAGHLQGLPQLRAALPAPQVGHRLPH